MLEIKGKVNTAVCFAKTVENESVEQIQRMCDHEFTRGSRIASCPTSMPEKSCTIGTTMMVQDKAVPNIVGVDIGCGMYTVRLNTSHIDFAKLDEAAHYIPSGQEVLGWPAGAFRPHGAEMLPEPQADKAAGEKPGHPRGGNHFIEVDKASDGTLYLVIHSGSRNLGKQVAELYQKLAIDLNKGMEVYFEKRDALICRIQSSRPAQGDSGGPESAAMDGKANHDSGGPFAIYIGNIFGRLSPRCRDLPAVRQTKPGKNGPDPAGAVRNRIYGCFPYHPQLYRYQKRGGFCGKGRRRP